MAAEASKGLSCRPLPLCALQRVWGPLSIGFTECCWMQQEPRSEDTGPGPRGYKLSPVSGLLANPGASYSQCLCLQLWYGGGMKSLQSHSVDGWKEKLLSCAPTFLHRMKHCRWARGGDKATFLSLLPPLLTGLQGTVGTRSKHLNTCCKAWVCYMAWHELGLNDREAVGTSPCLIPLCGVYVGWETPMALLKGHQNLWGLQWDRTKKNLLFSPFLLIKWKRENRMFHSQLQRIVKSLNFFFIAFAIHFLKPLRFVTFIMTVPPMSL